MAVKDTPQVGEYVMLDRVRRPWLKHFYLCQVLDDDWDSDTVLVGSVEWAWDEWVDCADLEPYPWTKVRLTWWWLVEVLGFEPTDIDGIQTYLEAA